MQSFIQPVQFRSQISNLPPLNPQTHPPTMVPSGFAGPNQFQNGFESGQRLISVSQPAYSNFSPSRPQFFGQNVQPNSIAPVRHQQVQQNPPLMTPVNQRLTEREFNRDLSPWSVRQVRYYSQLCPTTANIILYYVRFRRRILMTNLPRSFIHKGLSLLITVYHQSRESLLL